MQKIFLLLFLFCALHIKAQIPDSLKTELLRGYNTMQPLAAAFIDTLSHRDVKIIALGEATHGGKEINQFRGAVLLQLLAEGQLDMLVFEAPLGSMAAYHFYDSTRYEKETAFWPWANWEMKYVTDSIRSYNKAHPGHPVLVAGMDPQVTSFQGHLAQQVLGKYFPQDTAGIDFYNLENVKDTNRFRHLDRLEKVLQQRMPDLENKLGKSEFLFLQYTLQTMEQARVLESRGGRSQAQYRDSCMALNMTWLQNHFGDTGYSVIIVHNLHATNDSAGYARVPNMGAYLKKRWGDRYYILRMEFHEGSTWGLQFSYSRKKGVKYTWTSQEFLPGRKKEISYGLLRLCPAGDCFLDFTGSIKPALTFSGPSKQTGAVFYRRNFHLYPFPSMNADGILFFHRISPFNLVSTKK